MPVGDDEGEGQIQTGSGNLPIDFDATTGQESGGAKSGQALDVATPNVGSEGGADSTVVCTAQSCSGCCDLSGNCSAGTGDTACGGGGGACVDCTLVGQTCQAGSCGGTSSGKVADAASLDAARPTCNLLSCLSGCCLSGACQAGSADNLCGTLGLSCVDCTRSNQVCSRGACATGPRDAGRAGG